MKTQQQPTRQHPIKRQPTVTRAAAQVDAARRDLAQARRQAEHEVAALLDTIDDSALAVHARAVAACRAVRDADVGTAEWHRAVLEACAVADEADAAGVVPAHG